MQYGKHRHLEMIPGFLIWATFVAAFVLSFFAPVLAIAFIIVFDLYWMLRVVYFVLFVVYAWRRHKQCARIDWMQKLEREVPDWRQCWHMVFLPTAKEPLEIIDQTLRSLQHSTFPNDRILVVLAGEGRYADDFRPKAAQVEKKYKGVFAHLWITEHPDGLPDEIPGKGSNLNYAAGVVEKKIRALGIPFEQIIASSFDIDTVAHPQYFAYLAHVYATVDDPLRASYQPVVLYNNNMWDSPAPVRVAAFGTTFWLFGELARPERMWTFSSHSMPWQMLVDVGYWQKDIVSEDSRIFLQGVKRYGGDYRVEPLYLPVSMDAVSGTTYMDSMKALYKQQRRWAWGVEHFPYLVKEFLHDKRIGLWKRLRFVWQHIEGMYTWATAPLLIFVLGWLPLQIARHQPEALVHNAPFTLEWLMRISAVGIIVSGVVAFSLLPPRPQSFAKWRWIVLVLQWVLLPVTFVIFGAFPSIDAQTRMMFGRYLGFNVTQKKRTDT